MRVDVTLDLTPPQANSALDARIAAALERLSPEVGGQAEDVVDAEVIEPDTPPDLGEQDPSTP